MTDKTDSTVHRGIEFEREVASIYRALGADVKHNVALAGNQIDIVVHEKTSAGTPITTAIECKVYSRPVGVQIINSFASLAALLKNRGLIDKSTIVSSGGFTTEARQSADAMGIDLIEIDDLRKRISNKKQLFVQVSEQILVDDQVAADSPRPKRIFVLMPFAPEFNDVYILGIRATAEKLGFVVERADEIEHVGAIIDIVQDKIETCDAVIADTTSKNPNVFYEIGYANGVKKPIVLIGRDKEEIPFDLHGINHIRYSSIVDLRERLEKRLTCLFTGPTP